jgi:ankyrin repeat protein
MREDYQICGQAFVGCPGDADRFEQILRRVWNGLPFPGLRPELVHWKKHYDAFATTSAVPDQYLIARTSDPATNPVFILFAQTIGTPVRPPPEGWGALREWLDSNGWPFVALLGEPGFPDMASPPKGKIPLTGTMFELFDALRSGDSTHLKLYDVSALALLSDPDTPAHHQQREWRARLMVELGKTYAIATPKTISEFEAFAERDLRTAFRLSALNPLTDELPGLLAIDDDQPLLFGRGRLIGRISEEVFEGNRSLLLVTGVSGAGKSSLLRAGLMGSWFCQSPAGIGRRSKATALLATPDNLSQIDADPLVALAHILGEEQGFTDERIIGPLPAPFLAPQPPALSGDRKADLAASLAWWAGIASDASGPFILILDQAEQIEATARREAQARVDRGDDRELNVVLSASWQRFVDLILALAGECQLELVPDELSKPKAFQLILGLHRLNALDLWPLQKPAQSHDPIEVPPLASQQEWRDVIAGTCGAYGFSMDEQLLGAMVAEATKLATQGINVAPAEGAVDVITHSQASVLPQVKTALHLVMLQWRERVASGEIRDTDLLLDASAYSYVASIAGSIEALGSVAINAWASTIAKQRRLDLRGILERQKLGEEVARGTSDLFSGLIDASDQGRQDLTYVRRDAPRAIRQRELVEILRGYRLLTNTDISHFRLPHRTIIDHWSLARDWVGASGPRLACKLGLKARFTLAQHASEWPEIQLDAFIDLALNWIGSGEGEDGLLLDYLKSGLVARLDPTTVDLQGATTLSRLPFVAIANGDTDWVRAMITHCSKHPTWPNVAGNWLILLSQVGLSNVIVPIFSSLDQAQHLALVNHTDPETGNFPLLMAAQNGHAAVVEALLAAKADPNAVNDKDGACPLLWAAQVGHAEIAKMLIEKGAAIDQVNANSGAFPLYLAAKHDHPEVVKLILNRGANVDRVHEFTGDSPLLMAAQNGLAEVVKALLEANAFTDTPHAAIGVFPLLQAAQNGHAEIVKALLDRGAAVDQVNAIRGTFPLLQAAQNGHVEIVKLLLDKGAAVDQAHPTNGTNPLLLAANFGHLQVISVLIAKGAAVNQVNTSTGYFPLLVAAQNGHVAVVEALLAAKANPNAVNDKDGTFPLLLAAQNGHVVLIAAEN